MLICRPPISNTERQRQFQKQHPGYDARRKARERASTKRGAAQLFAAMLAEADAHAAAHLTAPPIKVPVDKPILMLPAPVVDPTMFSITALAASFAAVSAKVAIPRR